MKLKKDFFEKLLIYTFPTIIVIDIINRYLINNHMLYILNNIMYVGYFIVILVFLFNKNKNSKRKEKGQKTIEINYVIPTASHDLVRWGCFFIVSRNTKFTSKI